MPLRSSAPQNAPPIPAIPDTDPLSSARQRFRDLIVDRVLALESLRKNINTAPDPLQMMRGVSALAHKISGVAATLGFQHTGDLAAELERRLGSSTLHGLPVSETWLAAEPVLDELLDELEDLLDD